MEAQRTQREFRCVLCVSSLPEASGLRDQPKNLLGKKVSALDKKKGDTGRLIHLILICRPAVKVKLIPNQFENSRNNGIDSTTKS
jgi:hypothetical protein